jgi:hypothetical protein
MATKLSRRPFGPLPALGISVGLCQFPRAADTSFRIGRSASRTGLRRQPEVGHGAVVVSVSVADKSHDPALLPQSHLMRPVGPAASHHREPNGLQESRASGVFAQSGRGERLESSRTRMLDGVPHKLATETAPLPVISNCDRNLSHLGIFRRPDVPDHADGSDLVRGQRHICQMPVPVSLRHVVEQSLARLRYRGEEAQKARARREVQDSSLVGRAVGRAQGSNANCPPVIEGGASFGRAGALTRGHVDTAAMRRVSRREPAQPAPSDVAPAWGLPTVSRASSALERAGGRAAARAGRGSPSGSPAVHPRIRCVP